MSPIQKAVTLLGAGTQGTRLAYMVRFLPLHIRQSRTAPKLVKHQWSRCGQPVYLIDKNKSQLDRAWKQIQSLRDQGSYLGSDGSGKWGDVIRASSDELKPALAESWLTVECVPESLALKKTVVQELDSLAGQQTIVASNSSSYTITEILDSLKLKFPDRFASLHSYWPPETPAIEIMGDQHTRPDIISLLKEQTRQHGFEPFHVRKSSTGYIYNRIWAAIKREALFTIQEGVATPEEVDGIFKAVLKTPKGPCEQMDVVGLDVVLDIENHYAEVRPGLPDEPRKLLKEMLAQGKLGVKSGSGFFEYKGKEH
ncbi:hypothetical protein N7468_009947 [Penicillium chermesinum]|uniref:3-hydroxyacyl-CoA dehydrogenase n=1 Tax=Penicillium chermesinum TaxID=63820 RepID=A0A9W9NDH3_9EURO|nr:uncharacterized protein N7468_009947 [Penicillium chermesinum]KAJ5216939.1 hypothetical protein N7468_009947 [Penicillium chermesinum]